jgi:CheY-like chemotaxis protein
MSASGQRPVRASTGEEMPEQRLNPKTDDEECVVLYVEDDDATAYMFQKALEYNRDNVRLFRIDDGEKAVAFLFHEGIFHEAPVPDLVVLDLNLPKLSGFEVLARMRSADELKDMPVVMFSSSTRSEDREKALALGAREFFTKKSEWEEFVAISRKICSLAHPTKPRHRSADADARHIDYCLHLLGIRIWKDACQLIAKVDNGWVTIGPSRDLPVDLPAEVLASAGDSFILTVWQYEQEHPGTDIRQVLSRQKTFVTALAEHD